MKAIDNGQRDAARQAHYLSLSQRVGEVISDKELLLLQAHFPYHNRLDVVFAMVSLPQDTENLVRTLSVTLKGQKPLGNVIRMEDRFRRRKLFTALEKLFDDCSPFQRGLFNDSLNAQIHDDAARMLILKSLAEGDVGTLVIFGKLGIQFSVLTEIPLIADRLAKAFPEA